MGKDKKEKLLLSLFDLLFHHVSKKKLQTFKNLYKDQNNETSQIPD